MTALLPTREDVCSANARRLPAPRDDITGPCLLPSPKPAATR